MEIDRRPSFEIQVGDIGDELDVYRTDIRRIESFMFAMASMRVRTCMSFRRYSECKSLAAKTIEMLDNGFITSYDELYAVLIDRPSEPITGDNPHSNGEGSSSHCEAPQVFNDVSVVDRLRGIWAWGIDKPPPKNKVPMDIPEHGKDPFVDSNCSPQQRELNKKRAQEVLSYVSEGLHADGINSPPGQYVSIDIPSVNQQRKEYKGCELDRKKQDYISDGLNGIHSNGINSPLGQYVSIDISSVVNQQWKEYISGELDKKKWDYSMISESTLSIAGQAVGTMLSNIFSGSSNPSWTANFVAVATVFGIGFTLSGIGLRRVKPMLSGIMTKLGAVATASAIILALGQTVVPAVAWPAGAVACLLIYIGVAMA